MGTLILRTMRHVATKARRAWYKSRCLCMSFGTMWNVVALFTGSLYDIRECSGKNLPQIRVEASVL